MTNCTNSPAVITPLRTSRAPSHKTPTTPAKTRKITITVSSARVAMRSLADRKDCSVTSPNSALVPASWVKLCTVCTAPKASVALPEELAIQS